LFVPLKRKINGAKISEEIPGKLDRRKEALQVESDGSFSLENEIFISCKMKTQG
jgi:hypothetical protein